MNVPDAIREWCHEHGHGGIESTSPVSGGCINNGSRLKTTSGATFFLKQNPSAPEDMFAREAEGLKALAEADGPQVPQPLLHSRSYLLTEDLNPGPRAGDYWVHFGRQLGRLHRFTNAEFGFVHDNYLGSTPQQNPWTEDGFEFFAKHRLIYQSELAGRRGLLDPDDQDTVARLARRLPELVPAQPASLIHGDLWSGNAISDRAGQPAIIDPAAHYGWAEAELGMTQLFGAFPQEFYRAYQETNPLQEGWQARLPLYNLYHLLNHLNLFGTSYLDGVQRILRRFR